jgi:hypothetical protein
MRAAHECLSGVPGERLVGELAPELAPMLASLEMPANFVPLTNAVMAEMARRGVSRDRILSTLRKMGTEMPYASIKLLQARAEIWAPFCAHDAAVICSTHRQARTSTGHRSMLVPRARTREHWTLPHSRALGSAVWTPEHWYLLPRGPRAVVDAASAFCRCFWKPLLLSGACSAMQALALDSCGCGFPWERDDQKSV